MQHYTAKRHPHIVPRRATPSGAHQAYLEAVADGSDAARELGSNQDWATGARLSQTSPVQGRNREGQMSTGNQRSEPIWYLVINGAGVGPLSTIEVLAYIQNGMATATTYAWQVGFVDWLPLQSIQQFAALVLGIDARAESNYAASLEPQPVAGPVLYAERNPDSVLFSMRRIAAIADDLPVDISAGAAVRDESHHSGIIDIRAMVTDYENQAAPAGTAIQTQDSWSTTRISESHNAFPAAAISLTRDAQMSPDKRGWTSGLTTIGIAVALVVALAVVIGGATGAARAPVAARAANDGVPGSRAGHGAGQLGTRVASETSSVRSEVPARLAPAAMNDRNASATDRAATHPGATADKPVGTTAGTAFAARGGQSSDTPRGQARLRSPTLDRPSASASRYASGYADGYANGQASASALDRAARAPNRNLDGSALAHTARRAQEYEDRGALSSKSDMSASTAAAQQDTPTSAECPDQVACLLSENPPLCCAQVLAASDHDELPERPGRRSIRTRLIQAKAHIRNCGNKYTGKGAVKISVKVAPDGSVRRLLVKTAPTAALATCVAGVIKSITFDKSQKGTTFTFPFIF